MGASGEGRQQHEGHAVGAAHDFPACLGFQPIRIDFHPPTAGGIKAAERQIDEAFIFNRPAFDDGPIGLFHQSFAEEAGKIIERLAVATEDETAGCILVEPVGQHWGFGQSKLQCREILLNVDVAADGIGVRLMHGDSCGLVDDKHQRIAVKNTALNFFRCHWRVSSPFVPSVKALSKIHD